MQLSGHLAQSRGGKDTLSPTTDALQPPGSRPPLCSQVGDPSRSGAVRALFSFITVAVTEVTLRSSEYGGKNVSVSVTPEPTALSRSCFASGFVAVVVVTGELPPLR